MRKLFHNSQGFTLIELMVSMAIFSMIIAGIVSARFSQSDQSVTNLQAVEMQQSARAALFIMKKELRTAGFNDLPDDLNVGISAITANSITFSAVADAAGNLDTITYALQDRDADGDTDIARTINGGLDTLAENVSSLIFNYFDSNGNPLVPGVDDPADVRSIQIAVTATTDIGHQVGDTDNSTRTLTARVFLRNMGI